MFIYIVRQLHRNNRSGQIAYSTMDVFIREDAAQKYVEDYAREYHGIDDPNNFWDITGADTDWRTIGWTGQDKVLNLTVTWEILAHRVVESYKEVV